jgi:ribosomal subunit interface protein
MDLVMKGRGVRVTDQVRRIAEHGAEKLARLEPRAIRLEIEVGSERSPRLDGIKHLDGTLETPRRTFRASASAPEVDTALDQVLNKLERQVRDHADRRKKRVHDRTDRLKSPTIGPEVDTGGS